MFQSYSSREEDESPSSDIYPPENGFHFRKRVLMFIIVLFDPKLTHPLSISVISMQKKIFSFLTFSRRLDEERAAATPLVA